MRRNRERSVTGFYHVIIRGINKQNIFFDNSDRRFFLSLLRFYKRKYKISIHAYCIMDNHVHLLIEDSNFYISSFMQSLNSMYARYFNKKYDRIGHLFQNRFISENISDDSYYKTALRYILQNPEKSKICKTSDYIWSSYKLYKKKNNLCSWNYIRCFKTKEEFYSFININSNIELKDIELRPSEKESYLINKIKKLLHSNTTIINPDLPTEKILEKIRILKAAELSIRVISRFTGIMSWLVYKA